MLGWRTIVQLLARRAAESIAFSVPDGQALWSRAEEDLLVQAVAKYSASDVFGRDWIQVASDLPGRLPQQQRYRLADSVAHLTFAFMRVHAHRCLGYHSVITTVPSHRHSYISLLFISGFIV